MKKLAIFSAAALMSVTSICHAASLQSLDKKQLTQKLEDKTITTIPLVTINGALKKNTANVYFGKDNKINGKMDSKPDNDHQTDEGSWSVKPDGTLCVTWQHWNAAKPTCVFGYQLKNVLVLVNKKTKNLETIILSDNIKSGNSVK